MEPQSKRQNIHEEPLKSVPRKKVISKNIIEKVTELVLRIVILTSYF